MAYARIAQLFCFSFIVFRYVFSENMNFPATISFRLAVNLGRIAFLVFAFPDNMYEFSSWNEKESSTVAVELGSDVTVLECPPPDTPEFGGYGPLQPFYLPGDFIHYFCATDTYIGGNYLRICLDSGDWTGDAPVCDPPETFTHVHQTTTAEPAYKNEAESASDGARETCSSTEVGPDNVWTGTLPDVTQVIRVMLFLPTGNAAYEVFAVRPDGTELSCGGNEKYIARLEWIFHNCPGPHNVRISSVKIKSKSSQIPLRLCEVVTHVLTDPVCTDPHVFIENGHLTLNRKRATLVCDPGFTKSQDSTLRCIRTGVWQRKLIYCTDTDREVENLPGSSPVRDQVESERSQTS